MKLQQLFILIVAIFLLAACSRPIAQFETPQTAYKAQSEITFSNKSTDAESYLWDFGDGNTSTDKEPKHTYNKEGTYTVTLTAKDTKNKESITTQTVKVERPALSADFDFTKSADVAPAIVTFKNLSTGADKYVWDFGDYTQSEEKNPSHKYRFSGNYTVKLYALYGGKRKVIEKQVVIDAPEGECLILIETKYGDMKVRLYDETSKHRDNFIKLAEDGYLDGTLFHRIIDGFMIQGGDPDSKNAAPRAALGMGGPNYKIPAEINPELLHYKGVLAAARQPDVYNPEKESNGSQFYIVQGGEITDAMLTRYQQRKGIKYTKEQRSKYKKLGGAPQLDMEYTVFGEVVEGLEVIDKIATIKRDARNRPIDDVKMTVKAIK